MRSRERVPVTWLVLTRRADTERQQGHTHMERRPYMCTANRLSCAGQGEKLQQKANLPTHGSWIFSFQNWGTFLLFKPRWFQQCFVVVKAALPNKYIYAHAKMPLRSGRISYGFSYRNGHDLAVCLQSHRACKVVSLLGIRSPLSSPLWNH